MTLLSDNQGFDRLTQQKHNFKEFGRNIERSLRPELRNPWSRLVLWQVGEYDHCPIDDEDMKYVALFEWSYLLTIQYTGWVQSR